LLPFFCEETLLNIIEFKGITKRFGDFTANDKIDLTIIQGEIHCLLGENGAGKTTLMNNLFGLYNPDEGEILLRGETCRITNPSTAIKNGLGMIHQHFMLVERLSTTENIIAGEEPLKYGFVDLKRARKQVQKISDEYQLAVDPDKIIEDVSVGVQQRVEILKVLYRKAEILIFDEPTAVLTPQEVENLFNILRNLKAAGKTIIFITHKLDETMNISDRVTVLRKGRVIGTVHTSETTPQELANMMVGREVLLSVCKDDVDSGDKVLEVKNLSLSGSHKRKLLDDINLNVAKGEVVGIAGVAGNGQLELEECIAGLRRIKQGNLLLNSADITHLPTKARRKRGLAHIPSDRLKRALVPSYDLGKNIILGNHDNFTKNGFLQEKKINDYCKTIVAEFDVRCRSINDLAENLSGGNQQKLVIGREFSLNPDFILAAQPTRGVDVGAIEFIHNHILQMRKQKKAILLISAELEELISLADRILVMYEGKIVAEGCDFSKEELGLLMAGKKLENRSDQTNSSDGKKA